MGRQDVQTYGVLQVSMIDVRPADVFKQGHMPYALNIPADVFKSNVKNPEKLPSCWAGRRQCVLRSSGDFGRRLEREFGTSVLHAGEPGTEASLCLHGLHR